MSEVLHPDDKNCASIKTISSFIESRVSTSSCKFEIRGTKEWMKPKDKIVETISSLFIVLLTIRDSVKNLAISGDEFMRITVCWSQFISESTCQHCWDDGDASHTHFSLPSTFPGISIIAKVNIVDKEKHFLIT